MENQTISLEEFFLELLSAVKVCFEGTAQECDGAIVLEVPNGQKFRIVAETI